MNLQCPPDDLFIAASAIDLLPTEYLQWKCTYVTIQPMDWSSVSLFWMCIHYNVCIMV